MTTKSLAALRHELATAALAVVVRCQTDGLPSAGPQYIAKALADAPLTHDEWRWLLEALDAEMPASVRKARAADRGRA